MCSTHSDGACWLFFYLLPERELIFRLKGFGCKIGLPEQKDGGNVMRVRCRPEAYWERRSSWISGPRVSWSLLPGCRARTGSPVNTFGTDFRRFGRDRKRVISSSRRSIRISPSRVVAVIFTILRQGNAESLETACWHCKFC